MTLSLDEALGMSLVDEADESIHVGIDTRQVTIPESQQVFGVESDEDVEVKHIVIDGRYNDGTDLSTFTFRVNYQNANGDKGTYLATELKVNDSSIEFDWVIGRQVVAYKGTIAFIVRAYTIDSSSVIQNEWNSTLGKGTVLEGLEVSEFDFGDDIVRQLASILSDVNAAQASAKASADEAYKSKTEVVALGKEQQAAIEKKGKDTLATIPDDYTQVSNAVSQLKEATAKLKDGKISKFYASSQGNTNLPDSDDGRIMDLKLYGKSEQKQYSGKNLLEDGSLKSDDKGKIEYISAGKIKVTSSISTWYSAITNMLYLTPNTNYVLSAKCDSSNGRITCNSVVGSGTDIKCAFLTDSDGLATIAILCRYESAETQFIYSDLQLEKGSTATAYEPYVGGIPSPNPEYPQEIKSVVKPSVKVRGKNLVGELMVGVIGASTGNYYDDDTTWRVTDYIRVIPGEKYSLQNAAPGAEKWYYDADKKAIGSMPTGSNITVTIPNSVTYMRVSCKTESKDKFQIELGSTVTAYEPYTEQTVTLPYTLNAIPVTSGGNVTIDGQQYVADYVDVERGKLVKWIYHYHLDSAQYSEIKRYYLTGYDIITGVARDTSQSQLCREFYDTGTNSKGSQPYINVTAPATTEVNIFYVGVTPTETDLTADEIAAFKALVSHYPVTNVSTTSNQLDGYTVFNYPISLANGWNYVKQQIGDTRDYLYGIDLMTAEAYVNSEYAAALAEIEV